MSVSIPLRVLSVRDIDYEITPDTSFHPVCRNTALQRIGAAVSSRIPYTYDVLKDTLERALARNVWGVVLEQNHRPLYVIQNLANSNISRNFQRVVRIQVP
jgi:hypothetical protein